RRSCFRRRRFARTRAHRGSRERRSRSRGSPNRKCRCAYPSVRASRIRARASTRVLRGCSPNRKGRRNWSTERDRLVPRASAPARREPTGGGARWGRGGGGSRGGGSTSARAARTNRRTRSRGRRRRRDVSSHERDGRHVNRSDDEKEEREGIAAPTDFERRVA